MRLAEISPETDVGAYNPQTGDYLSLGGGWAGSDAVREHIDAEYGWSEYLLVAELSTVDSFEHEGESA